MTKVTENWFKTWFDTKYYHILYKHRNNEEANLFIGKLVNYLKLSPGLKVADICCGKGRHSIELSKYGLMVWGIDLSPNSIESANSMSNELTSFDVHDMRIPFSQNNFDAVFNLFTSFGYFENALEDKKCLENIFSSLKSGGTFIQDYIHAGYFTQDFPLKEEKLIDHVSFGISKYVQGGFIVKEIHVKDGVYEEVFFERVKIYTLDELISLHEQAGFMVEHVFGDYQLSSFSASESQRIILNSRKK
jgi:SAM-dependent methyltransferase